LEAIEVRRLCRWVAGVGLVAVAVLLLKPVDASFGDDPLLRLQAFDRPLGSMATKVDCGSVFNSLGESSAAVTIYTIARDQACHREGWRRLIAAIAAASAVVVLTLLILVVSGPGGAEPPRPSGRPPRLASERPAHPPETGAGGRLGLGGSGSVSREAEDRSPSEPG
jgi:hypothetical protein